VSRSVECEYCGNQRSVKATTSGALIEDQVRDLLDFEKSTRYDERQKAALAYAEAITWHTPADDAFWQRMYKHFSEAELVELGCMIGLTLGQQSWLRCSTSTTTKCSPGLPPRWRRASRTRALSPTPRLHPSTG